MTNFYEIQELVKLFNPPKENDSDSDSDSHCNNPNTVACDDGLSKTKVNPYEKVVLPSQEKHARADSSVDEITLSCDSEVTSDWKQKPKWNISYRQQVTASDVFLQMGAKTPATTSCEDMVITIDLPGEHMQNMDVKVHPNKVFVQSPNFNVRIPLPHLVHPQKGEAKWNKDQEKLILTLKMEREFDFINF